MSNTFQWTDETVLEFINNFKYLAISERHLQDFKASKEPKKEWEIVDFQVHKDSKLLYTLREDGRYRADAHQQRDGFSLDSMLRESEIIHSVRRLSDGEVFSVGDRLQNFKNPITRVNVGDRFVGGIGFECGDNGEGTALFAAKKLPAPLFTTLDGVEINPATPNRIYPVDKDFGYMVTTLTEYNKDAWGNHRVFSTREAAQEYIENNKPLLSLNDVKEAWNDFGWLKHEEAFEKLTNLVKSKL